MAVANELTTADGRWAEKVRRGQEFQAMCDAEDSEHVVIDLTDSAAVKAAV